MDKQEIGKKIAEIRNKCNIDTLLSGYAVQSIECCRSSYPVSNLITICHDLRLQLYLEDKNTGEKFPVDSVEDCHAIIGFLMDRYDVDKEAVYRLTGRHYTPPKGDSKHLSIDTLYDVCKALKADLGLLTK